MFQSNIQRNRDFELIDISHQCVFNDPFLAGEEVDFGAIGTVTLKILDQLFRCVFGTENGNGPAPWILTVRPSTGLRRCDGRTTKLCLILRMRVQE